MTNNQKTDILIGTSGWSYPHWKGLFYPDDWPKNRWFEYYTTKFPTVEVNATFYRFFKDSTYQKWYDKAPENFKYVLKAPRLITHRKYLQNVEDIIQSFCKSTALLKDKFGLILLQLPPGMPYDPNRLRKALAAFDNPRCVTVEFRHERWLNDKTIDLLREMGSIFCNADSPKTPLTDWATSDTAYIRLHGREAWYGYEYSNHELQNIYGIIHKIIAKGTKQVYVFFNNDIGGFAPKNALKLSEMLLGGCSG